MSTEHDRPALVLFTDRAAEYARTNGIQVDTSQRAFARHAFAAHAFDPPGSPPVFLLRHANNLIDPTDGYSPAAAQVDGAIINIPDISPRPTHTITLQRWTTAEANRRLWPGLRNPSRPENVGARRAARSRIITLMGGAILMFGGALLGGLGDRVRSESVVYAGIASAILGTLAIVGTMLSHTTNRPRIIFGRNLPPALTIRRQNEQS